jgi:hypothetical protein
MVNESAVMCCILVIVWLRYFFLEVGISLAYDVNVGSGKVLFEIHQMELRKL